MFTKERKIIKENLDKKLIQKEKVGAEIQRQNNLYDNVYCVINGYDSFKSAKRLLVKIIIFLACWCGGEYLFLALFCLMICFSQWQKPMN